MIRREAARSGKMIHGSNDGDGNASSLQAVEQKGTLAVGAAQHAPLEEGHPEEDEAAALQEAVPQGRVAQRAVRRERREVQRPVHLDGHRGPAWARDNHVDREQAVRRCSLHRVGNL